MSQIPTGSKYSIITWAQPAAAGAVDRVIFTAPVDCVLLDANFVSSTVGSDGSAVNIQLTKDAVADAPGAGTDLLANNTNAGFDLKGTINTPQYATFKTTAGIRNLPRGTRVSLDYAGTQTAVDGVLITLLVAFDIA